MKVFVDVDDTLVIYAGNHVHPHGVLRGDPYKPNYALIEKLKKLDGGDLIIWSGEECRYAEEVGLLVLGDIPFKAATKGDDSLHIRPGDIIIDDQKDCYASLKVLGIHVFGPHEDWNLEEVDSV